MDSISWQDFDGTRFQRLCNRLLYTEVSKKAQLYTAPGADGGIDQYYTGTWEGLTGKWRFQDKFKKTDKATALSHLRADIRDDIKEHAKDEDIIVYLTNVNPLPQDERELEAIAVKALTELGCHPLPKVLFWHHAKLEAMILSSPLLINQFFATTEPLLDDYRDHFQPQLTSTDLRHQLTNPFVGRTTALQALTDFLAGSDTMLAITGPGNMGKTRLVLQFFQQIVDAGNEWLGLVLKSEGFTATAFSLLLSTGRKMVILIDDAHWHLPILAAVKNEIDKKAGLVKVILTTRKTQLAKVKKAIPTHARRVGELLVTRLDPIETKTVYRSLLPWQSEENLQWLRDHSNGLPGVIVAHCHQINQFGHPLDLAADEDFIDSTMDMVDQDIQTVVEQTKLPARSIMEFIHGIALLGPVKDDANQRIALAMMLGIPEVDLEAIGRSLEKTGLIRFVEDIGILGEPVSDTILRKVLLDNPTWVKKMACHVLARPYLGNIVNNLSTLEVPTDNATAFVQTLCDEYVQGIVAPPATEAAIRQIMETALRLSFRLPQFAIAAVTLFGQIWKDATHPLHHKPLWATESPLQKLKSDASRVLASLFRGTASPDKIDKYFPFFRQCVEQLGDPNLVYPCFGFGPYDFNNVTLSSGPCCFRQLYLCAAVKDYFTSDDPSEVAIALSAVECLYVPDVTTSTTFDRYTGGFTHSRFFVPDLLEVRKLRQQLVSGLISYHRKHRHDPEPPLQWFKKLSRVLLNLFNPRGEQGHIDETGELTLVLEYFSALLTTDATMAERAEVVHSLHLMERHEVKVAFEAQYQALEELLTPKTREQRLELYLTAIDHYRHRRKDQLQTLLLEFPDMAEFVSAVKKIVSNNCQLEPSTLNDLALFLRDHHPEQARELFDHVIDQAPTYIPNLCRIGDSYLKNEDEFFARMDKIWTLDEQHTYVSTVISMLLSPLRIEQKGLRIRDLDYLSWAIENGDATCIYRLDYHLYRYADLDKPRTWDLLRRLAARPEKPAGNVVYAICEDTGFCDRHEKEVIALCKELVLSIGLGAAEIRPAMKLIGEREGDEALFSFLTDEVRKPSAAGHYSLRRYRLFAGESYAEECRLFKAYFSWMLTYPHPLLALIRHQLLQYFLPHWPATPEQTTQLEDCVRLMIDDYTDATTLQLLGTTLQGFCPYNTCTLSLQIRLAEKCGTLLPIMVDPAVIFGDDFMDNSETSKTSHPNQPAFEDLGKAAFLQKFMEHTPVSPRVRDVLCRALAKVEADIEEARKPVVWQ